ncbi:MAG: EscN/YscN/HrcN family type III secretion system ATPase, partial [Polyangiaceae bacterium]
MDIGALKAKLAVTPSLRTTGRVLGVSGISLRFALPGVRIGDVVIVNRRSGELACEVVAFAEGVAVGMPLGALTGVGPDDEVIGTGSPFVVRASKSLLGRVVDGLGRVIDGGAEITDGEIIPVDRDPPRALDRKPVAQALATGVRAIDACCTLGEGQRIGLFSASGVGKSTLLGAVARGVAADVVVVGLVGERGREVGE